MKDPPVDDKDAVNGEDPVNTKDTKTIDVIERL